MVKKIHTARNFLFPKVKPKINLINSIIRSTFTKDMNLILFTKKRS